MKTVARRGGTAPDKRARVLAAALQLIPRLGLHNTPMSAIAESAGVAKGTPYLYFESKEALINDLYRELTDAREQVVQEAMSRSGDSRERLWEVWASFARWHLDHPQAVNVIQQCEASGILPPDTQARELQRRAEGGASFAQAIREGLLRELPLPVFYAHFAGPILVLSQLREKGEMEITEEVLRLTFEGVVRAVLLPSAVSAALPPGRRARRGPAEAR